MSGDGLVTAHRAGSATISVRTANKKKASLKLRVKKAPAGVELGGCAAELGLGEGGTLAAILPPDSAGGASFSCDDPAVLRVDPESGAFSALAIGETTVRARTYNGKIASREIAVKAAPESLALSQTEATLGAGETMPLPEVELGEDCAGSVRFTSLTPSRAAVLEDGRIKARKAGDVVIEAATYNNLTAQFLLHVVKAPMKLSLLPHHRVLGVGEELTLDHRFRPGGTSSALRYESGNPSVATVDEAGRVVAVGVGSAKIVARTYNKKSASVQFTVLPRPESIELPAELALGQGEKYALQSALKPEGSGGGIRFWADDPSVAEIDELTGEIRAIAPGETIVHAELYSGLSAECALRVGSAPTGIRFQDASFKLSVNDSFQLQPPALEGEGAASGSIRYKSSGKCVKVSQTGLVTAVKAGRAVISISTYNKKTARLTVTVKSAPKSISFAEDERRLFIDREFTPEVSFSNGAVAHYALTSSNPSVAAIGANGVSVRGVSGGTATITATSYNGARSDTTRVLVPFPPERVSLDPSALELGAGDRATLRATFPEGQGSEMVYESSDAAVAGVEQLDNETVSVVAHAAGSAEIVARAQNGREGKVQLTVLAAPTALRLTPSRAERNLDEGALQLRWSFGEAGEGGRVEFASSDPAVASVDSSGLVKLLGVGSVNIVARSYNGHTAACALTIGSAPARMVFERAKFLVALGDEARLPVRFEGGCESYALEAADGSILEASGDTVRALALGETHVTATSRSGLRAECDVLVVDAPTGLELTPASAELTAFVGETLALRANPLPDGVGGVYFASSDPSVAAVDSATGLVTPVGKGECSIRAFTCDGKHSASCALRVKLPLDGWKIGIDPGHQAKGDMRRERVSPKGGGTKPRCAHSSSGVAHVSEHKINLQVGMKLRDALERLGAEVCMTRETADVNISNRERALMMNRLGVDLVLRIHCNAWSSGGPHGFTIIRRKSCAYKDEDVDPRQGSGKNLLNSEKKLANSIARFYRQETGAKKRGVGANNEYTMNNWAKMPCLLVELGFMTNPKEGRKLVQPEYQEKMVRGLVEGICDYASAPMPVEW